MAVNELSSVMDDVGTMPERDVERFDENFTLRIKHEMRAEIDRLASEERRSAGYIARLALERGLAALREAIERGERL